MSESQLGNILGLSKKFKLLYDILFKFNFDILQFANEKFFLYRQLIKIYFKYDFENNKNNTKLPFFFFFLVTKVMSGFDPKILYI